MRNANRRLTLGIGADTPMTTSRPAIVAEFFLLVTVLVFTLAPSSHAAVGDHFSFAPTSARNTTDAYATTTDAFAPAARAWWAGVCHLTSGDFEIGGDPGTRFSNCIDHPATIHDVGYLAPPLACKPVDPKSPDGPCTVLTPNLDPVSGSGPDGWAMLDIQPDQSLQSNPAGGPDWRLADVTGAGTRPDGSGSFWFGRQQGRAGGAGQESAAAPDGQPRTIIGHLPPGVIGDPTAVPKCPSEALRTVPLTCHPNTQVGTSTIALQANTAVYPVYNVEPRDGYAAEFVIAGVGVGDQLATNVPVLARARTEGDFGVDAMAIQIPAAANFLGQTVTFWGVPWAASHDNYRPVAAHCVPVIVVNPFGDNGWAARGMSPQGLTGGVEETAGRECSQEPVPYDNSWGPIKPFLTTQTECSPQNPVTGIESDNWHNRSVIATADSIAPLVTDCDELPFNPTATFEPTSTGADSPTGLAVDIDIPSNDEPPAGARFNPDDTDPASAVSHWKSDAGLATSQLEKTIVTLPEGMAVNPSGATGLAGCSDAQIGVRDATTNPLLFNNEDPFDGEGAECPAGSVIGTASATTPVLDETLTGEFVLGTPKSTNPQSGQMFRLFLVLRNRERGLLAKVFGSTVADPVTGRLTTTFEKNPRVPVDNIQVDLKGGNRGTLAMPQTCGARAIDSQFSPWTAAHGGGGPVRGLSDPFTVGGDCSFDFNPALAAGMSNGRGGEHGTFSFEFSRPQGDRSLRGLTAVLPKGLVAAVKGLPLCTNAQANAGNCPATSRIGLVDASAGSGDPFVIEQKGEIFLTEGYKGGPYGLMVKVRAIAGPFRGAMELSPIVVRQAIHVDRRTAQVTAVSDPFPLIHHGVPLRVRRVLVNVDRPSFMLNPSSCEPKAVNAAISSEQGTVANLSNPFQASECSKLRFRPKLTMRLTGRRQVRTGKHPGIRAKVTQTGIGEAGIEKAVVRLPKSLALDVDNAQALCEFEDGTKPDIENRCPKGSIVGRARAISPLLNDPLVGNVYFVKNIRIDPDTGNEIRTLPMIIVALRGEIAINLRGESNTTKSGKLVNTFNDVPDAPVSRFNLNVKGGKNGILAVTRTRRGMINLCKRPRGHVAEAEMDGQNGKVFDRAITMKTPCRRRARKSACVTRKQRATKRCQRRAAKRVAAKKRRS